MENTLGKKPRGRSGVTRRGFFGTAAAGASGAALAGTAAPLAAQTARPVETARAQAVDCVLTVNGRRHDIAIEPDSTLLHVLRERLGMQATKVGCERGECGACTVLIDGIARYACMTLALEAEGAQITTLEGLMKDDQLGPVQQAFAAEDAFQCGYCTPGQMMAAEGLLRANPSPDTAQIRAGMSGNLCRCGTYAHIFRAVAKAAELKRG